MDNDTCMELALEGERLCKAGNGCDGIAYLEAAIRAGTSDLKTLSAIYSQLGNAYFSLGDYVKAMDYHRNDLTLTRSINDRIGEAKASGNLGNTLKVMGQFDEAVICCRRHLDISRELGDKIGEGRALYNLGNVYHAKGKHIGKLGHQDHREFPEEVKICLQKAVEYYEANLQLMASLDDRSAQGRACGNLGNTHYLLGNFIQAINYHEKRVAIAKEFGDKAAERRAFSNLGNAHIFLGKFEAAAENYKRTLTLSQELGDRAVEAQACYSLGNTYTLLKDYPSAIEFHIRHLRIAQELMDKIGESRACWSLSNAHSAIGNHEKALHFANKHLEISKEIGDHTGQATAKMNVMDLIKVLGLNILSNKNISNSVSSDLTTTEVDNHPRRNSMENLDLLTLTPDTNIATNEKNKSKNSWEASKQEKTDESLSSEDQMCGLKIGVKENLPQQSNSMDEDSFFELVSRFQEKRMDDQRCSLNTTENKENHQVMNNCRESISSGNNMTNNGTFQSASGSASSMSSESTSKKEDLLELIAGMQSKRLDEQRASLPRLPGLNNNTAPPLSHRFSTDATNIPDDNFFDMLMRCQGTRIEDQRSTFPPERPSAPTVPDEDFFSLIIRLQSGRIEDQRSSIPINKAPSKHSNKGSTKSNTSLFSGNTPSKMKTGRSSKNKH